MATDWYMEGPWLKNCNCDPGCPCDFNQTPTQGHCEGLATMRIDKGHFGDVDLSGLCFAGVVRWPGPIHEGNGEIVPLIDEQADERQREALLRILSGQEGDTMFEIFAFVCPTVHEPQFVPFEFEFDLENRRGAGDVVETESDTLRGIDPPDPYRVVVRIPNGFEYTNENEEAETTLAKRIVARGPIEYSLVDSHQLYVLRAARQHLSDWSQTDGRRGLTHTKRGRALVLHRFPCAPEVDCDPGSNRPRLGA